MLKEVPLGNLEKLSAIYEKSLPKHVVIYSTIKLFTKRLKTFPELKNLFKLFAVSDDWENNGKFLAVVSFTSIER
jgi:hypothetical protein